MAVRRYSSLAGLGGGLRAAIWVVLCCSGCASAPRVTEAPTSWEQRLPVLQAISKFELSGRVAASDGQQGFSAGLHWQQRDESATLDLTAPLGFGAAHIEQTPDVLSVTTSKGVTLTNEAASEELAATLGFEPPLHSMRYWVLGASDPSLPAQESVDDQQRLAHLEQDGWLVDCADYELIGKQWLPRRLTVTRQRLRLKLIVESWRL